MNFQNYCCRALHGEECTFYFHVACKCFFIEVPAGCFHGYCVLHFQYFFFSLIIVGLSFESGVTFYASGALIQKNKLIWFVVLWSFVLVALVLAAIALYFHFSSGAHEVLDNRYYYFGVTYIAGLFLTNCAAALFYTQNNFCCPMRCLLPGISC